MPFNLREVPGVFYVSLLLLIIVILAIHTPVIVWTGVQFPALTFGIKAWKEVVMALATLVLAAILYMQPLRFKPLLKDTLLRLIAAYVLLHFMLSFFNWGGWHSYVEGMLLDLRYVWFFALVYIAVRLKFIAVGAYYLAFLVGACLVIGFAILQLTVLPPDVLTYIGYSSTTILPYMTVDQDHAFIRINSTLRGPNPLGAYATITFAIALAYFAEGAWRKYTKYATILAGVILVGSLWTVYSSYSRAALLGSLLVAMLLFSRFAINFFNLSWKKVGLILIAGILVLAGLIYFYKDTHFVSQTIFHNNPNIKDNIDSNSGHLNSLQDGLSRMLVQPFGAGIGSTGSASYYSERHEPLYIENQYLHIAHESGWIGLGLFMTIFVLTLRRVYSATTDWLGSGVFFAGLGLGLIGIFLPVFQDDTVSLIWWGLAGLVAGRYVQSSSAIESFVYWNRRASRWFDTRFVPKKMRQDALEDFVHNLAPAVITAKNVRSVGDIGGGKRPFVGMYMPKKNLRVIGIDIDEHELNHAPKNSYDRTVVLDIGASTMPKDVPASDVVICQFLLEHVYDNRRAIKNIYELTEPNGHALLLVPSRHAVFARINLMLPEAFKRKLLSGIFPESAHAQGFPAYYHNCTPKEMIALCKKAGFEVTTVKYYYHGNYFSFFVPIHIIWRMYQMAAYALVGDVIADYYYIDAVARKKGKSHGKKRTRK